MFIALLSIADSAKTLSGLDTDKFKKTVSGKAVDIYILTNKAGAEVCLSNYGATILSFVVNDKNGKPKDIVLGLSSIDAYTARATYLGPTIGRFANRIAGASFSIGGQSYKLEANDGSNTLHSGASGFHTRVFTATQTNTNSVDMTYTAPDKEGGFPGNLKTTVKWSLSDDNELTMDVTATTDKATVVSITNHAHFNLDGGNCDAMGTLLTIPAEQYVPVNSAHIPTGKLASVAGTPFDFRKSTAIDAKINSNDEQLRYGNGYDHTFVITTTPGTLKTAAIATSKTSGITLECKTTLPGIQLYTGNGLDGSAGKLPGTSNKKRYGFCLEPQFFPDTPNQPTFPSATLKPTDTYHHIIVFKATAK
jgi:aldose 1-epimerase